MSAELAISGETRVIPASDLRFIAFYLPQFHPIPENDAWWGPGFTEWTNVVRRCPLFPGHYQPHLPAHLGFYDLRLPETRRAQAEMAREYGIDAFCYYHYWFNGKRLLERPFNEVLTSGEPDFPFCLCWANENWTRAWDGRDREILLAQHYTVDDDRRHIDSLVRAFDDRRYLRVRDRPVFLVYRACRLPDPLRTTDVWREEARRHGLGDILLLRVESFAEEHGDPVQIGFDGAVEFQPDWTRLPAPIANGRMSRLTRHIGLGQSRAVDHNRIYDYSTVMESMIAKPDAPYTRYGCVTPGWDNSARRAHGAVILHNSTPELYARWLRAAVDRARRNQQQEPLIFINAWNEWAEGNHLEPCQRWGLDYLHATRAAKRSVQLVPGRAGPLGRG